MDGLTHKSTKPSVALRTSIDDMEAPLHDIHALSAVMVSAIAGMDRSPVDHSLMVDGLLRLGASISDIAGRLKEQQSVAFKLAVAGKELPEAATPAVRLIAKEVSPTCA